MKHCPILQIGDILVSSEIITEFFCCNYEECRGKCCIIGDSGAPLLEEETELLERDYPSFKSYMTQEACRRAEECGFFEVDRDGDLVTPLLGNSEECVYTRFEGDNCLCAIERCNAAGKCGFVKPISCRLYPIRAKQFRDGTVALNLHCWELCEGAFAKGKKMGMRVYQFLEGPLTAAYGEDFYKELRSVAESYLAETE